jgi:hypothetical protein
VTESILPDRDKILQTLQRERENSLRMAAESDARIKQKAIEYADELLTAALKRSSEPVVVAAFMQTVAINRAARIIAAEIESAAPKMD